jgi:hypothetical protein
MLFAFAKANLIQQIFWSLHIIFVLKDVKNMMVLLDTTKHIFFTNRKCFQQFVTNFELYIF